MAIIDEHLGRVLSDRYRLMKPIASGSSAHVYAATDVTLKRTVAIKLLHPGLSGDKHFSKLLLQEAHAVASLNHPNIVQVYDCGTDQGNSYLVLEYLSGGSLAALFDSGSHLDVSQACSLGLELARGLAYAHRRGFIHRDIKPANILFSEDQVPKIADFGLAKALAAASTTEPLGGQLVTARYASPEQAEGIALDARSDVYSLAIVLYEAVTGKVPFLKDTTLATLTARVGAILPRANELGPLMPILAQAAISEPLARLDSAELVKELEILKSYLKPALPLPIRVAEISSPPQESKIAKSSKVVQTPQLKNDKGGRESDDDLGDDLIASGLIKESRSGVNAKEHRSKTGKDADFVSNADKSDLSSALAEEPFNVFGVDKKSGKGKFFAITLVILILLAGGGFYAYGKLKYSQKVPSLVGVSYQRAKSLVLANNLKLDISHRRYSSIEPAGLVISQSPAPGIRLEKGQVVKIILSLGHAPVAVPLHLVGEKEAAVVAKLSGDGFKYTVIDKYQNKIPAGQVVSVIPSSGMVKFGSKIKITESKGPAPRTIPQLAGYDWAQASLKLSKLGLSPVQVTSFSNTITAGEVISTSPAMGTKGIPVGSKVTVNISKGPLLVAVPSVSGMTIKEAITAINNAGLQVTEQIGPPFATTASTTSPAPGTEVRPGTSITLYVS